MQGSVSVCAALCEFLYSNHMLSQGTGGLRVVLWWNVIILLLALEATLLDDPLETICVLRAVLVTHDGRVSSDRPCVLVL